MDFASLYGRDEPNLIAFVSAMEHELLPYDCMRSDVVGEGMGLMVYPGHLAVVVYETLAV